MDMIKEFLGPITALALKNFITLDSTVCVKNPDFSNFVKLSTFKHRVDETKIKMRFYFQGVTDFHVLFSKNAGLPKNEKMFNICKYVSKSL